MVFSFSNKKDYKKAEKKDKKFKREFIEDLSALVKLPLTQIMGTTERGLIVALSALALGDKDVGKFEIDEFKTRPVGVIDLDIIFEVTGKIVKVTDREDLDK